MIIALTQIVRYGLVGFLSNALAYALYLLIISAGIDHKFSMTIAYSLGVIQAFVFNKRWSFKQQGNDGAQFMRYCFVYFLGYIFNLTALYILVDQLQWPEALAQGIMILVVALFIFTLQKYWVFHKYPVRHQT